MKRRAGTPAAAWFYGESFNAHALEVERRQYQCRRPGCLVTTVSDDGLCVACRLIEQVRK